MILFDTDGGLYRACFFKTLKLQTPISLIQHKLMELYAYFYIYRSVDDIESAKPGKRDGPLLKVIGKFFNIVRFFIDLSSVNKKNVLIKIFEPTERRKYVFCGLKSALGVIMTLCARVFALVLRYMRNQYLYIWPQNVFSPLRRPKKLNKYAFLVH